MELSKPAQEILNKLIAQQDLDHRVKRAFSESEMVELALRVLDNMNKHPLDRQGQMILGLSVTEFEVSRKDG